MKIYECPACNKAYRDDNFEGWDPGDECFSCGFEGEFEEHKVVDDNYSEEEE